MRKVWVEVTRKTRNAARLTRACRRRAARLREALGVSTPPRVALQLFARTIRGAFLIIFRKEKGSALPVQIPSLWAESGPAPRCLSPAIWKEETNFFAQPVLLFSRIWEYQQQQDSA